MTGVQTCALPIWILPVRSPRSTLRPLTVALAVALAACGTAAGPVSTQIPSAAVPVATGLTIYAAASLSATMAAVKRVYEAARPGITLAVSTDSSTALATRIEQGAPADLLLAADTANPQRLVDQGLAAGSVTIFAANLLAIIVPIANPARIADPVDLARAGVKIIGCADNVPIARYAARSKSHRTTCRSMSLQNQPATK